ncbi:MAG: hypothetical protein ACREVY_11560 [Gammaproteobacteria bacterium]
MGQFSIIAVGHFYFIANSVPDRKVFGGVARYYSEVADALELPYDGEVMNEVLRDARLKSDPVHPTARAIAASASAWPCC